MLERILERWRVDLSVQRGPRQQGSKQPAERVHVVVERPDGTPLIRLPAPRWLVSVENLAIYGIFARPAPRRRRLLVP